ncbi:MAG: ABC transporter ATP-binding protein [Chloroflexota bacterium]
MQRIDGQQASSSRPPLLLATDLRKSYGSREALKGLSFSASAGRVLGFLGPNGAGKTTAIRILTTILEPTSGHFVVDGVSSDHPDQVRRKIGVLPESLGFPKHATALEYLTYFGQLYGRTATLARNYGLALLEEVGLQHRAKSLIGTYSRGMQQRLGIARALVHDPVVVFLDEPTLGLDPRGQRELLSLVRQIAAGRTTAVILCSHLLPEIEGVCDDVIILQSGQVIAAGPVDEVTASAQRNVVRIHVPAPQVEEAQGVLGGVPGVVRVAPTGGAVGWLVVELAPRSGETSPEADPVTTRLLDTLVRAEIPVISFETGGSRLQEAFLQLTEEAAR